MKISNVVPQELKEQAAQSRNRYDWATLSDGRLYTLTRGEDFNGDPRGFIQWARASFKALGRKLRYVAVTSESTEIQLWGEPLDTTEAEKKPAAKKTTEKKPAEKSTLANRRESGKKPPKRTTRK